jgi:cyclic dehypoxanthinyl futalosine synthase
MNEDSEIPLKHNPGGSSRMTAAEAVQLLESGDLLELGARADAAARRLHPEPWRTWAIDRNINFTNRCDCRCRFCAFWRAPDDPQAYVLTDDQIAEKVREAVALGATHLLMQGGMTATLGLTYYEDMLRRIKSHFAVTLHCFSPPEIHDLAVRERLPVRTVLERLREAGLDSLPGGGAEILVDRVRRIVSPRKCTAGEWLAVMREAHGLGMATTATMVFGHVETAAERVEHLAHLRDLQDETGGFLSFIAWPFQPGGTALAAGGDLGPLWRPAGGVEYLKMVAVARLFLDNIMNVQASWVTMGPGLGQVALAFGANDLGSTMIEENVVAAAGCVHRASPELLRRLIREAGFEPRQRNSRYELVDTAPRG